MKPRPECPRIEPDLTAYLTGDLPAARAAAVRDHLSECASCRASAQELANTLDLLRGALAACPASPDRLTPERRAAVLSARPSRTAVWLDTWLVPLARAAVFLLIPAAILAALAVPYMAGSARRARTAGKEAGTGAFGWSAPPETDGRGAPLPGPGLAPAHPEVATVSVGEQQRMDADMRTEQRAARGLAMADARETAKQGAAEVWFDRDGATVAMKSLEERVAPPSRPLPSPPVQSEPAEIAAASRRRTAVAKPADEELGTDRELNRSVSTSTHIGAMTATKTPNMEPAGTPQPRIVIVEPGSLKDAPSSEGAEVGRLLAQTPAALSSGVAVPSAAAPTPAVEAERLAGSARANAPASIVTGASRESEETLRSRSDLAMRKAGEGAAAGAGGPLGRRSAAPAPSGHGPADAPVLARRALDAVAGARSDRLAADKGRVGWEDASGSRGDPSGPTRDVEFNRKSEAKPDADVSDAIAMRGLLAARQGGKEVPPPADAAMASAAAPSKANRTKDGESQTRPSGGRAGPSAAQGSAEPDAARAPRREPAVFNPVVETAENAISTFSIDVDTASYTMARRAILEGRRPEPESIRTEEFVNAFDYDYPPPATGAFAIHVDGAPSPFRKSMDALRIGVKGRRIGRDRHVPANLTLVIDTSGSMQTDDRIGLVRRSLRMLVGRLDPDDRVAVVQFGSTAALRLEPTPAAEADRILGVIDSLETVGSTQLEGGLKLGYEVAARAFRSGASNRVILMSDGVANLGATEADAILATVEAHRRQGVRLTVLGFGSGAYDDTLLETLADRGDGAYAFIDSEEEAKRVLVDDLAATLHVIASDAKIQVEFNPRRVARWRQLGYENRALAPEQFRDDAVDAGEVGSGQAVTALYDVQLAGDATEWIGVVRVRYRDVETGRVEEMERRISARDFTRDFAAAPPRFRLAVAVAEFAEMLRLSPHTFSQGRDFSDLLAVVRPVAMELSLDPRVRELAELARTAASLPD